MQPDMNTNMLNIAPLQHVDHETTLHAVTVLDLLSMLTYLREEELNMFELCSDSKACSRLKWIWGLKTFDNCQVFWLSF